MSMGFDFAEEIHREAIDAFERDKHDRLTPDEAAAALKDLEGLFTYLSVHGFTTPIPSVVRLVQHLQIRAGLSDEVKSATK